MVDTHMANLSNQLMLGAVLVYVVAMVAYAAEIAFARNRADAAVPEPAKVLVGAGGPETTDADEAPAVEDERRKVDWGRFAILMNVVGWGLHGAEIVTRGMAADRVPWGNMYEFVSAIAFAAVTVYLVMLWRYKINWLGPFLMVAVVIALAIIASVGRRRRRSPRPLASAGVGAIRVVAAPAVGEPAGTAFLTVQGDLRCGLRCGLRRVLQAGRMCIIGKVLREGMGLRCRRHAQGDRRRGSKCCKKAFHGIS